MLSKPFTVLGLMRAKEEEDLKKTTKKNRFKKRKNNNRNNNNINTKYSISPPPQKSINK